jgi:putative NADH-flavin reductase
MKILIIGATRGIGRRLMDQALEKGHAVSVMARHSGTFTASDGQATTVVGDIRDQAAVDRAVKGQQAVCCCIGIPPTFRPVTVFSEGIKNVLRGMKMRGVQRLICVTGIGAGDSRGHGGFFYDRLVQPLLLRAIYADKDRQERLIRQSTAEWIIVRPGFLTNGPLTGTYRVLTELTGVKAGKISRADVAHFMLTQLQTPTFLRQSPLLTY